MKSFVVDFTKVPEHVKPEVIKLWRAILEDIGYTLPHKESCTSAAYYRTYGDALIYGSDINTLKDMETIDGEYKTKYDGVNDIVHFLNLPKEIFHSELYEDIPEGSKFRYMIGSNNVYTKLKTAYGKFNMYDENYNHISVLVENDFRVVRVKDA